MTTTPSGLDDFDGAGQLAPGEIPRDQYRNAKLPHPVTGEVTIWRQPSKIAECLPDDWALTKWKTRMTAKGVAMRPDLRALAYATELDDSRTLNSVAWQAMEYAGSKAKANHGSATHALFATYDRDPAAWKAGPDQAMNERVRAYVYAMRDAGITVMPDWVERFVLNLALVAAGTLDRGLTCPAWSYPRVGDLKTGKYDNIMKYNQLDYSAQIATYAAATWALPADGWWPERDDRYVKPPDWDRQVGVMVVIDHETTPIGVRFVEVDLVAGLEAARLAIDVTEWRKRKNLLVAVDYAPRPDPLLAEIDRALVEQVATDLGVALETALSEPQSAEPAEPVQPDAPAPEAAKTTTAAPTEAAPAPAKRGRGRPSKAQLAADAETALAPIREARQRREAALATLAPAEPLTVDPAPPAEASVESQEKSPAIDVATGNPLPAPGEVGALLARIDAAEDRGDLSELWQEWTSAGLEWLPEWTARGSRRLGALAAQRAG